MPIVPTNTFIAALKFPVRLTRDEASSNVRAASVAVWNGTEFGDDRRPDRRAPDLNPAIPDTAAPGRAPA